jgi:hypothetical protein
MAEEIGIGGETVTGRTAIANEIGAGIATAEGIETGRGKMIRRKIEIGIEIEIGRIEIGIEIGRGIGRNEGERIHQ